MRAQDDLPASPGATRRRRLPSEPDWLCDGAYFDEFGRTWHCERVKHGPSQRHQSSVFIDADGEPGTVGWDKHLEWAGPW